MKYKGMSIKKFLQEDIDLVRFYDELYEELDKLDKLELLRKRKKEIPKREGKLKGLPFSLKDCICAKGEKTYSGSKILQGYKPLFDSTVVKKIKENSGGLIGKTHQDEFGFGTFSTNCAYATPKNPWDTERSCGGSSGGAGGLTAALDLPHIAIGESTGGSISNPASFCGVVGLTPTYGLVSRHGLISYGNSLDKIGTLSRSVYGAALGLDVITGKDVKDQTTVAAEGNYLEALDKPLDGLKIGVPKEYFNNTNAEVEKVVRDSIQELEDMGITIVDISLPMTEYALPAYFIIACAEASTNLAKFCGLRYGLQEDIAGDFNQYFSKIRTKGFSQEAKRRVMTGTFTRMAGFRDKYYMKALKIRRKVIEDFKQSFKKVDAMAIPTMPIVAPKFKDIDKLTPADIYYLDILSVPANFAGIPHISMNCGFKDGMPVGLEFLGNHFEEQKILNIAQKFEEKKGKPDYPKV